MFVQVPVVIAALCGAGAVAGAAASDALAGRKSTFAGLLAGAAAGCALGLGGGLAIGVGAEAVFPTWMAAGGNVVTWGGLGATGGQLAAAEAAATGGATIWGTFTGTALNLAEAVGVSATVTYPYWSNLSSKFVSGASSATALVGPELTAASVLVTRELPVLQRLGVNITFVFHP